MNNNVDNSNIEDELITPESIENNVWKFDDNISQNVDKSTVTNIDEEIDNLDFEPNNEDIHNNTQVQSEPPKYTNIVEQPLINPENTTNENTIDNNQYKVKPGNINSESQTTNNNTYQQPESNNYVPRKEKKTLFKTMIGPSIILLAASLVNEFLIVPKVARKLAYKFMEFLFDNITNIQLVKICSYTFATILLAILIFAFCMIVYSVINLLKRGDLMIGIIKHIKKILLYSLLASIVLIVLESAFNIDLITPVVKLITFNGTPLQKLYMF